MSRLTRVGTVVAAAAVAAMVAACGATTTNPNAPGSSSSSAAAPTSAAAGASSTGGGSAGSSSAAPGSSSGPAGSSSAAGPSSAASSAAGPSSAASSAAGGTAAEPTPLNLNLPADPTLAAMVPKSLNGTLIIATDATYAPNEFLPNGQGDPIGMDIDLGNAIGQVLGLKTEWKPTQFDGIINGINAGRYNMSLSSFTDTKDREKQVNFVTYLEAGVSIVVAKGNPQNITTSVDLCGKKVGAENGTTEQDMLTKADVSDSVVKICSDAGKPAPEFSGFPTQSDVNTALASGRLDAYMADTPVAEYAVKMTGDKFEKAGKDVGVAPYGIAIPKNPPELTTAVQKAVQKLMDDGDYMKILDNWGLGDAGIKTAGVNQAIY